MTRSSLIALCCTLCLSTSALAQQHGRWFATWGTAQPLAVETLPPWVQPPPADKLPPNPPPSPILPVPAQLDDATVRMIVRISAGGDRLRLQFANALGTPATTLGAVHVAHHLGNGRIEPASDRTVTFGGSPTVTLHPGALVVSDPVALPVTALSELAVSLHLPGNTDTRSRHDLGLNTTYIADRDQTARAALEATQSNRSYLWLTGIETFAQGDGATIVAFGDSITDGFSTTPDTHRAWPALLSERLQRNPATARFAVVNAGISGNRVLRAGAAASALTRFDRDVLARSGCSWIILLEGINDITFTALPGVPESERATAAGISEGLAQLIDRAHAAGIKVMGATLTPMGGLWLYNEQTEAMRQAVNTWIRGGGKFDAVVDFDAVTRDPTDPSRLKPEYDSGDHIHPNDAGNAAMAAAIEIARFAQ